MTRCALAIVTVLAAAFCGMAADEFKPTHTVGLAKVDITPDYPVRLTGYAARTSESTGVAQRVWARALAVGTDREGPSVLITVDNCGVPGGIRDEVARRLEAKHKIVPGQVTVCSTHTHSAPWLAGYVPLIFLGPLPPSEQAHVERYTRETTDALETVAIQALKDRRPAALTHSKTKAGFAANRRTKNGPVDHDVPVLCVWDRSGKLRGILTSYACHCTTLTGEFNQICGDWAGYAAEYLEQENSGAVVLVAVGCGGDANPNPRPGFELARQHGREMASAISAVQMACTKVPKSQVQCSTREIHLPFDRLPTRAEWENLAKDASYVGQHARTNLARLDRGEKLPESLPYMVQTWAFGKDLALVFLPGEVTVDYSLRLKRELDASRLWVMAYANDVPCYIPSERVLREGGYEGGHAMIYYDKPTRFAPGVEDRIVQTVQDLLPQTFKTQNRHVSK